MSDALGGGLFNAFLEYLFATGGLSIPKDYHSQCNSVKNMLSNDVTGTITTVTDYAINSASETIYAIESNNETIEKLLNIWLTKINLMVDGIPTGIHELTKEFYKELWQGSSLCLLRVSSWKNITVDATTISVPTVLWFVNGASVYVKRDDKNFKLGSDKFFLDEHFKNEVPANKNENIVISKQKARWFDKYPTPYLVRNGVLKNYLGIQAIQDKSDEVITKILPYLFIINKGTERMFIDGKVDYKDSDLTTLVDNFKTALETYKAETNATPVNAIPFDQKYEHLIPDLRNILSEELYRQGYRALLCGLGFIDVLQGVSSTRKESVLNPKPFIAEVNAGVDGFKTVLLEIINVIIAKNKVDHKKLFSENNELKITNSPLKINVEVILDQLRSGFVYGIISVQSYQEILGIDPDKELQRMKKEWNEGLREIYYPHLIQNQEATPDNEVKAAPITKKQIEKTQEKTKKPINMKKAEVINEPIDPNLETLEEAPYQNLEVLPEGVKKYPKHAQEIWLAAFNAALKQKPGDEAYAFRVAWSALQKYMKKQEKK
jgi:cation transport regulator ChaB